MASLPAQFIDISDIYRRLEALEYCVEKLNEMCGNTNSVLKQLVEVHRNGIKEEANQSSEGQTLIQSK